MGSCLVLDELTVYPLRAPTSPRHEQAARLGVARLLLAAAGVLVLAVSLLAAAALLTSKSPALTSDESLYYAEAINIANGRGAAYTTGAAVVHRPVLFPALLAAQGKVAGHDLADAYWLPRLLALLAAIVAAALTGRLFGTAQGIVALALVSANAYLNTMGNSLYVDTGESLFLLCAALLLVPSIRGPSIAASAAAGLATAAAFWTKESAVLWLPLPFVLIAVIRREVESRDLAALAAYTLSAGIPIAAWWAWVYHVNHSVFLMGAGGLPAVWLVVATPVAVSAVLLLAAARLAGSVELRRVRRAAAAVFIVAWTLIWMWGLERHSWPYPHNYWIGVPQYLWRVGPNVQPYYLLFPAWAWVAWRASRGSDGARLLAAAALVHLPLFLFSAQRFLALRDSLPLVYLSLVALSLAIVDGLRWAAKYIVDEPLAAPLGLLGAAMVAGAVSLPQLATYRGANVAGDSAAVSQENWNNPLAQRTAAWIADNVPPGTPVMTSRLYYSSIFTLTDGRYPVSQLPTLRVQFLGERLQPMSTQFRWEDDQLARYGHGSWIYLRQYPQKGYLIGLTGQDVEDDLRARHIEYLVITGEDAGYSSFTYLDFFLESPGLQLVHIDQPDAGNAAYVFRVRDPNAVAHSVPLTMSQLTATALKRELGSAYDAALAGLAPSLRISPEGGVPAAAESELAARATVKRSR